jgi:hypothetical protein
VCCAACGTTRLTSQRPPRLWCESCSAGGRHSCSSKHGARGSGGLERRWLGIAAADRSQVKAAHCRRTGIGRGHPRSAVMIRSAPNVTPTAMTLLSRAFDLFVESRTRYNARAGPSGRSKYRAAGEHGNLHPTSGSWWKCYPTSLGVGAHQKCKPAKVLLRLLRTTDDIQPWDKWTFPSSTCANRRRLPRRRRP